MDESSSTLSPPCLGQLSILLEPVKYMVQVVYILVVQMYKHALGSIEIDLIKITCLFIFL